MIDADSEPLRYVLKCCGSHQPFTFTQIGCGHTVLSKLIGANLEVHTLVGEVDGNGNGNVIIWKWRPTTKSTVGHSISILQTTQIYII